MEGADDTPNGRWLYLNKPLCVDGQRISNEKHIN